MAYSQRKRKEQRQFSAKQKGNAQKRRVVSRSTPCSSVVHVVKHKISVNHAKPVKKQVLGRAAKPDKKVRAAKKPARVLSRGSKVDQKKSSVKLSSRQQPSTEKKTKSSNALSSRLEKFILSDASARLKYLQNWKRLKTAAAIREGKRLREYLEELTKRQTDKFMLKVREVIADSDLVDDYTGEFSHFDEDSDRMERFAFGDSEDEIESILKNINLKDIE